MSVSGECFDGTKQNVPIIGPELKDALKQSSTQIEREPQIDIPRIQTEFDHDDSDVLRNFVTC